MNNNENNQVVVVAIAKVKAGAESDFIELTSKLVRLSLEEPGTSVFQLHQSLEDSQTFVFHEIFDSQAAADQHRAEKHTQDWFAAAKPLLEGSPQIHALKAKNFA